MAHITAHAVQRYRERIEDIPDHEALDAMIRIEPTIDRAAAFGCATVIMGNGARLRLVGDTVCTVLPKLKLKRRR